jgi:N-acetylglucosamine-6-phosphate deacetylase
VERLAAQRVLRPDGSLRPGTVVVDGGRVDTVLDDAGASPPDLTLAPGLVDLQVNGFGDLDVWAGGTEALGLVLRDAGTTAWCPTLTSRPLAEYRAWFDAHPAPAPGEIGVHLEGPFLQPARAGAHPVAALRPPDAAWLAALPPRARLVTLAPELPGALDAIARLRAAGVIVALGHSDATYEEALGAAEAGATVVAHVFNAMAPLHHRAPGLAGAALTDPRLTPAVIGDGVHVHPAVLALVLSSGRAVLVSDAVRADAAVLPDGRLGGSTVTLADCVRVAVGAGVPLATALRAATAGPADVIGRPDLGRLVPGARGDVVAFDGALRVVQVASR